MQNVNDILDILRTNCHSIKELEQFSFENGLQRTDISVLMRRSELESIQDSEDNCDVFKLLCSHFSSYEEFCESFKQDIQEKIPTVLRVKEYLSKKCDLCLNVYSSRRSMLVHRASCERLRRCIHCSKIFSNRLLAKTHQNLCKQATRECELCRKVFTSDGSFKKHTYHCRASSKKRSLDKEANTSRCKKAATSTIRCRTCNEAFSDRAELWRHRQTQHGGAIENLQDFQVDIDDEDVRREYDANRRFILAPTVPTRDNTVYNFPTNDLEGGYREIQEQLEEVFESQVNAFKLNLSFGLILKNSSTNKLRYFIPHNNETLFNASEAISSRRDIERVMQRIKNIDIQDHLQNSKDNSEWKVQMVTNLNYNVTPTNFPLGSFIDLPDFVKDKHCIVPLTHNSKGKPYVDNLCMFRALHYHRYQTIDEKGVELYFDLWKRIKKLKCDVASFSGVEFSEIPLFEDTFEIGINMFELVSSSSAFPRHLTRTKYNDVMNLNIYEGHISYAKNLQQLISKFLCSTCTRHFSKHSKLREHSAICAKSRSMKYPGNFVKPSRTIFEELEQYGVVIPEQDRKTEYFCTFDFESMLKRTNTRVSEKLYVSHEHIPVSWAIKSNIPGYIDTKFYCSDNIENLVQEMVRYLNLLSLECEKILRERYKSAFQALDEQLNSLKNPTSSQTSSGASEKVSSQQNAGEFSTGFLGDSSSDSEPSDTESDNDFIDDEFVNTNNDNYPNPYLEQNSAEMSNPTNKNDNGLKFVATNLSQTIKKLDLYCKRLIVLGFNSESYDLPLVMQNLLKFINFTNDSFCVKKGSKYKCIQTERFKFLDIRNYISATCTYDQFIKAYGTGGEKSFWPYEWFDDYKKLESTSLPPIDAFYSELKMSNVLGQSESEIEENYKKLTDLWHSKQMNCMRDLLQFYNVVDVEYFVGAVENMLQYYFDENVDLFKTTISLPNYARNLVFRSVDVPFPLFDKKDSDLYKMYRASSAGGPSIVFNRYACKDKTFIRNNPLKPVKSIIGWDMNNMYGYAIAQDMPTSIYIQYHAETGFRAEPCTRYMDQYFWLDYVAETENINITHRMNNEMKEVRIANLFCDGFSMKDGKITVYEYDSNYYHFCCPYCPTVLSENKKTREFQLRARERTLNKKAYLESLGIEVITMHECEFKRHIKPNIQHIIDRYFPETFKAGKRFSSENAIIKAIENETLFGAIYCDIEVPATWDEQSGHSGFWHSLTPQEYFAEMSPIFCVSDIYPDDFGVHMTQFCNDANFKPNKRRLLVGGLKANRIMLSTSLVKWYLAHGLKISKIYRVVQFTPRKCFASFVEKGTAMRRLGDSCPDKKILAEKYKLQINSLFGSFLRNKEKERQFSFVNSSHQLRLKANNPKFVQSRPLSDSHFEVEMIKNRLVLDNPVYLGHTILNKAKELLLDFYFSFLDRYFERDDFMLMCSDTDSAFVALSSENYESIVKPHLRDEFNARVYGRCHLDRIRPSEGYFLTRKCCEIHRKFDAREPGLWKTEATGTEILCLSSKTYLLTEHEKPVKMSCKGANKCAVKTPLDVYRKVLFQKETGQVENRGIRKIDNMISTYHQKRNSFHYFYVKRTVLDDGVSTMPLNVALTPWPHSFKVLGFNDPLANVHFRPLIIDNKTFFCSSQVLLYKQALFEEKPNLAESVLSSQTVKQLTQFKREMPMTEQWLPEALKICTLVLHEKKRQWAIKHDYFESLRSQTIFAAGWDYFWECGMEKKLAEVSNPNEFRGENNLGKLIEKFVVEYFS